LSNELWRKTLEKLENWPWERRAPDPRVGRKEVIEVIPRRDGLAHAERPTLWEFAAIVTFWKIETEPIAAAKDKRRASGKKWKAYKSNRLEKTRELQVQHPNPCPFLQYPSRVVPAYDFRQGKLERVGYIPASKELVKSPAREWVISTDGVPAVLIEVIVERRAVLVCRRHFDSIFRRPAR
jgi:hypothetical protein